jgi:hypothetical protein
LESNYYRQSLLLSCVSIQYLVVVVEAVGGQFGDAGGGQGVASEQGAGDASS